MKYLIIGLLILSCSGCGIFMGARDQDKDALFSEMGVYPATRFDLGMLDLTREGHIGAYDMVILSFVIIELPITFIYETLLFPYDYYKEARNPCNRDDNKNEILKKITKRAKYETGQKHRFEPQKNNKEFDDKDVNITQIHEKYNFDLVEYNYDNNTEKRLSLFAIKDQEIKNKTEYVFDGVNDNADYIKTYFKEKSKIELHDMIDCYKSIPTNN
jgi:uncharacterized protein YceK